MSLTAGVGTATGGRVSVVAGSGVTGGALVLAAGAGSLQYGGSISVVGGSGGTRGGAVQIMSGAGTSPTSSGDVVVRSANSLTAGVSGSITLSTGVATGASSGGVLVGTGAATTGDSGSVRFVTAVVWCQCLREHGHVTVRAFAVWQLGCRRCNDWCWWPSVHHRRRGHNCNVSAPAVVAVVVPFPLLTRWCCRVLLAVQLQRRRRAHCLWRRGDVGWRSVHCRGTVYNRHAGSAVAKWWADQRCWRRRRLRKYLGRQRAGRHR